MRKSWAFPACLALVLAIGSPPAWSDITVDFEGGYNFGLYDWWKWETDVWDPPAAGPTVFEAIPGHGGTGSAQAVCTLYGNHYVLKTMAAVSAGLDYVASVWVQTRLYNGSPGVPSSSTWVEFGWDPLGRDTTQPPEAGLLTWCTDPRHDFDNNAGNWVKYSGELFTALGTSVTIAFKVGSTDTVNGIYVLFDDLEIAQYTGLYPRYQLPDTFDTTYTLAVADGWRLRFLSHDAKPHWAEAPGRSGSAQRLCASTDTLDLAVNFGAVKLFEVLPNQIYNLSLWINVSDSSGTTLADANPIDPGPIVKFGVDATAQNTDPEATTILWNTNPTQYFSTPGNENTWQTFDTPMFRATTDTVSVWLWVQGDSLVGVDARFDDLHVKTSADPRRWRMYR